METANGTVVFPATELAKWHSIELKVSGPPGAVMPEAFLDGVSMLTTTDNGSLVSGTAAVGTFGMNIQVQFDDVKASTP